MRNLILKTALIAGAALAVAGCNRADTAANNAAANELDANMTMGEPANDASAMESATNQAEPAAPAETNAGGSDTGGNNVESNTLGM
ncbi:MAG TPA: hypothetical protein VK614_03805 [Allosphingosinicella sp.]|nr:hypothetical protein [Allosphingosinicella sp.]